MNIRLLYSLLLGLAMLFAQQGAALHALSHLAEKAPAQSQQEKHLPHSQSCEKCVAYAGVGSGVSSSPLVFASADKIAIFATVIFLTFFSAPLRAYRSRAPPCLA
jgi:hypothetical protein